MPWKELADTAHKIGVSITIKKLDTSDYVSILISREEKYYSLKYPRKSPNSVSDLNIWTCSIVVCTADILYES